jgi:hypothetical protein
MEKENKLSSTAVIKIDSGAAKEAQYDLPQSYGKTESCLLPKDPAWMFLFWDIVKDTYDGIAGAHGAGIFAESRSVIRVYDITDIAAFDGQNAHAYFDVPVFLDARSWYINVPQSGRRYICDLGIITPQGGFILLTRSNSILIPAGRVSDIIDERWMLVEGEYQKLLKMAGADIWGGGAAGASERLQHLLAQRWKMLGLEGAPSSHVSSFFSPASADIVKTAAPETGEDIWLKADCELIIYGQASQTAQVSVAGRPLRLNDDGGFSMRYSLPAGAEVLVPITARHKEKEGEKRAITIKAVRDREAYLGAKPAFSRLCCTRICLLSDTRNTLISLRKTGFLRPWRRLICRCLTFTKD